LVEQLGIVELLLIAVGLSADAFAVAVCRGLGMKKLNFTHAVIIAGFFGFFQGLMPVIGFILGERFESYIMNYDHWVAFVLLSFIGGKMIIEAIKCDEEEESKDTERLNIKDLFVMAIATSIDALAVGIIFALDSVNIFSSVGIIAITTFILSFIGVIIGNKFGTRYKKWAELIGGIILVLIGLKILLEHLEIINF